MRLPDAVDAVEVEHAVPSATTATPEEARG
jgi:hypothetical protein